MQIVDPENKSTYQLNIPTIHKAQRTLKRVGKTVEYQILHGTYMRYVYLYLYIFTTLSIIYFSTSTFLFFRKNKCKNTSGTLKKKMNLRVSLGLCASLTWIYLVFCCLCKKSLILKMLFNELLSVKIHKLWKIKHWTELKC